MRRSFYASIIIAALVSLASACRSITPTESLPSTPTLALTEIPKPSSTATSTSTPTMTPTPSATPTTTPTPRGGGAGRIAFAEGCEIYLINSDGSDKRRVAEVGSQSCPFSLIWSPDGQYIAVGELRQQSDGQVRSDSFSIIRMRDSRVLRFSVSEATSSILPRSFTWSPDSNQIAFVELKQQGYESSYGLFVANIDSLKITPMKAGAGPISDISWSSDGKEIFVDRSGRITVVDVKSRKVVTTCQVSGHR